MSYEAPEGDGYPTYEELCGRSNKVVALHSPQGGRSCVECRKHWPCPTYLLALGQDPATYQRSPGT